MIEDAVRFYNDLLDDNLATETWSQLVAAMKTRHLAFGDRLLCTVLRPHFLTEADYATLQGECALILSAFRKAYHALMADRSFRAQMDLTPEEETVIAYDPGFDLPHPLSRLDSFYSHADQTLHFVEYNGETPAGAGYEDVLAETFLELPVMQHFQQRYRLRPVPVRGEVLQTLLAMYRQWGRRDRPTIGIIDWRGVPTTEEFHIFQEYFERQGYHAVIAPPWSTALACWSRPACRSRSSTSVSWPANCWIGTAWITPSSTPSVTTRCAWSTRSGRKSFTRK
jgi:hypothetical protein